MATEFHAILLPVRPQPDTLIAIFMLKKFGKERYPGIDKAEVRTSNTLPAGETAESLIAKGTLPVDMGGSHLDHHAASGKTTAAQLVADDLGIAAHPPIQKMLLYAERDDKYGKGTISTDPLDRLFGFSGLVAAVNKSIPANPERAVQIFMPLLLAHYLEEKKRTEDIPQEFDQKMNAGEVDLFEVRGGGKKLKVVILVSDNPSLAGWLRSSEGPKSDVVAQYSSSGHLNILTRPVKRIDLRGLAACLRFREAELKGRPVSAPIFYLARTAKISEVPEWYYDRATNSIQNGGVNPGSVAPTKISRAELKTIIESGFSDGVLSQFYSASDPSRAPSGREQVSAEPSGPREYFLEARIPQESGREIFSLIDSASPGAKLHRPENYHITLMHFGERAEDEARELVQGIRERLSGVEPFALTVRGGQLSSGEITGYENTKAFYFLLDAASGGGQLQEIRNRLERGTEGAHQAFIPHLTVASTKSDVVDGVARDAAIEARRDAEVTVPIKKLRLTEVFRDSSGMVKYRARQHFLLGEAAPSGSAASTASDGEGAEREVI